MAKGKKRNRAGGNTWTGIDHATRSLHKKEKKSAEDAGLSQGERRTLARTRDSKDKRNAKKLQLHIAKTKRDIDKLRERLELWDDLAETKLATKENKQQEQVDEPVKKKGRKGPETWKLRGAARPAAEVYDFDTRYVDPHLKAHEEASAKVKRQRNIFVVFKGRLGEEGEDGPPQPHCRNFLALLMQLGLLFMQAHKYKAARSAFIECMELDGIENPITSARTRLMRLYLEANRPDSARRLSERLPDDPSVWIRYSAALVEFVSWKLLNEKGSSQASAESLLAEAIKSNMFCGFYIAFHSTFEHVMEYSDEIEDADEGTLEEAIEYGNSEQLDTWHETDGAVEWVRQFILRSLHGLDVGGGVLQSSDLCWKEALSKYEQAYAASQPCTTGQDSGTRNDNVNDGNDESVDVCMFAGMFRTAMEMLEDAGELNNPISSKSPNAQSTIR